MGLKLFLILMIFCAEFLFAQSTNQIDAENSRLAGIKKEISKIENDIKSQKVSEKESVKFLVSLDKKILLLNNYINELQREGKKIERQIHSINLQVKDINRNIKRLQDSFAEYLVWIYKNGQSSKLGYFLYSDGFNESMSRMKYSEIITNYVKSNIISLKDDKTRRKVLLASLKGKKKKKNELISEKKTEIANFENSKKSRSKLLAKLRKNKKSLFQELQSKRAAENKIESRIAELIRKENERLAKLKAGERSKTNLYDYGEFENFNELRGKLNWPVSKGKINRNFGKIKNEKLNTVTLNYGIDIETIKNASVKSVSGGIVSIIEWIPGYGSVLIITHKNNYRTVYGHLTDINVSEGDKVNAGFILGKVNESLEGNILHFEIWQERKFQNPNVWLSRR